MLADFGFTRVATISVKLSSEEQGTASFMAPELLFSTKFGLKKGVPSKEADVYALGMTVYQVLTGKWPFFPKKESEVIHAVILGGRPPKPENAEGIGMTEVVWDLVEECWREDRTKRPIISEVLGRFCDITGDRKTTDSMIEAAGPQLDTSGNRDSIHSESTLVQCEWDDPPFERPYPMLL
jgi:serine/threonine protein kinase